MGVLPNIGRSGLSKLTDGQKLLYDNHDNSELRLVVVVKFLNEHDGESAKVEIVELETVGSEREEGIGTQFWASANNLYPQ